MRPPPGPGRSACCPMSRLEFREVARPPAPAGRSRRRPSSWPPWAHALLRPTVSGLAETAALRRPLSRRRPQPTPSARAGPPARPSHAGGPSTNRPGECRSRSYRRRSTAQKPRYGYLRRRILAEHHGVSLGVARHRRTARLRSISLWDRGVSTREPLLAALSLWGACSPLSLARLCTEGNEIGEDRGPADVGGFGRRQQRCHPLIHRFIWMQQCGSTAWFGQLNTVGRGRSECDDWDPRAS